jgi:hypothetical protein
MAAERAWHLATATLWYYPDPRETLRRNRRAGGEIVFISSISSLDHSEGSAFFQKPGSAA